MRSVIKNLFMVAILAVMSMSFTSCSSSIVTDVKIKIADKVKVAVQKELTKAFEVVSVQGVDCNLEAEKSSDYLHGKVLGFLKVESKSTEKSLSFSTDGLMQKACVFVVDKGLLYLIDKSGDSNLCLKELGRVKVIDVASEVCGKIKF